MKTGDLNRRVTFQYPTKATDSMGGFTTTWVDALTTWAALWPKSAKKQIEAMQPHLDVTHQIRIRYKSVLKPSWRVKYRDRYFSIVSIINPEMRNEMLDLLCKESVE